MSYFDPNAQAQANGYQHGRLNGEREGFRQGEEQGYDAGHADGYNAGHVDGHAIGYDKGWNECVQVANGEMSKQIEFTNQHIAEKKLLKIQLEEQSRLIQQLTDKLDQMEYENIGLKESNHGLRDVIHALKKTNDNLQSEVQLLEEKVREKTDEFNEHLWQYNRTVVFMKTLRSVLDDLTAEGGPQAEKIRDVFSKRYSEHIYDALRNGFITTALDKDDELAHSMPQTRKFIANMLNHVRENSPDGIRQSMDERACSMTEHDDMSPT